MPSLTAHHLGGNSVVGQVPPVGDWLGGPRVVDYPDGDHGAASCGPGGDVQTSAGDTFGDPAQPVTGTDLTDPHAVVHHLQPGRAHPHPAVSGGAVAHHVGDEFAQAPGQHDPEPEVDGGDGLAQL